MMVYEILQYSVFFRLNAGQIRLLLCLKILFVYTEQEHSANWYVLSGVGVSFGRENMRFYQQNVCWTKKIVFGSMRSKSFLRFFLLF